MSVTNIFAIFVNLTKKDGETTIKSASTEYLSSAEFEAKQIACKYQLDAYNIAFDVNTEEDADFTNLRDYLSHAHTLGVYDQAKSLVLKFGSERVITELKLHPETEYWLNEANYESPISADEQDLFESWCAVRELLVRARTLRILPQILKVLKQEVPSVLAYAKDRFPEQFAKETGM